MERIERFMDRPGTCDAKPPGLSLSEVGMRTDRGMGDERGTRAARRRVPGWISAICFTLLVAGCRAAPDSERTVSTASGAATGVAAEKAEAAADAKPSCRHSDFSAFLEEFSENVSTQRQATSDPLLMESIDAGAQPEPQPVVRQVPLADVEFPVMANAAQREAEGLQWSTASVAGGDMEVTLRKPDTDMQIRFGFRAQPCWTLVKVSDDSM